MMGMRATEGSSPSRQRPPPSELDAKVPFPDRSFLLLRCGAEAEAPGAVAQGVGGRSGTGITDGESGTGSGSFPPHDVPLFAANDFWLTRRLGTGKFSDVFEALQDDAVDADGDDNWSNINNSGATHRSSLAADSHHHQQQQQRLVVIKCLKPVSDRKVRREVAVLRRAKEGGAVTVVRLLGIVLHPTDTTEDDDDKENSRDNHHPGGIYPASGPHPMPSLVLEHAGPQSQWLCHPTTTAATAAAAAAAAATASSASSLPGPLSDYEIRYYVCHLLAALRDLHRLGIMHRDVKPRNVLINRNNWNGIVRNHAEDFMHHQHISKPLVLIDLGLADFYSPRAAYNVRVASRHYKSPELLLAYPYYTPALDLWGVGCVLAGLLLRREPFFRGRDNPDQLVKIVSVLGTQDLQRYVDTYGMAHPAATPGSAGEGEEDGSSGSSNVWQNLPKERVADWNAVRGPDCPIAPAQGIDLLDRLLVYDHEARCTAQQAMDHPFFDPVRDRVEAEIRALRRADHDLGEVRRRNSSQTNRPVPESALSFLSSTSDR
jgi:casein kinase II subunit alpha